MRSQQPQQGRLGWINIDTKQELGPVSQTRGRGDRERRERRSAIVDKVGCRRTDFIQLHPQSSCNLRGGCCVAWRPCSPCLGGIFWSLLMHMLMRHCTKSPKAALLLVWVQVLYKTAWLFVFFLALSCFGAYQAVTSSTKGDTEITEPSQALLAIA